MTTTPAGTGFKHLEDGSIEDIELLARKVRDFTDAMYIAVDGMRAVAAHQKGLPAPPTRREMQELIDARHELVVAHCWATAALERCAELERRLELARGDE